MKRRVLFFLLFLVVGLAPWEPIVSAAPPGIIRSPLSVLIKWIWGPPAPTSKADRNFPQFESGYMVETVLEGNKLGIDPYTIEVSPDGDLLVLDSVNSNIFRLTPPLSRYSTARLLAGSSQGYSGYVDGRPRDARFNHPKGFTADDSGNVYVADTINMAIRKISEAGVTTIAGGRSNRAGHVDGPSEGAKFSSDFDVVYVSSTCSLLVVDRGNQAIREIRLNYDDCAYNNATSYSSGILMVAGAFSVGYILGLLQQEGSGTSMFSRSAKQNKPSKKSLPASAKTDRPPLIPVDGQTENVDAGWMSFGRFILDLFKFAAEIIGGTYAYLRGFTGRKTAQKKGDLWPLRDTLNMPDDDVEPQSMPRNHQRKRDSRPLHDTLYTADDDAEPRPMYRSHQRKGDSWPLQDTFPMPDEDVEPRPMSRNHQKKGDLWPLRDTLVIPDDDPKSKPNSVKKNSVASEDSNAHIFTSVSSKVTQNLHARSVRVTKSTMNFDKSMNNNNRSPAYRGEDRNYMQSLRHQSSAPETHYEKSYDSSNGVVFGAVQETEGKYQTVEIKPVDYGDPMYDHYSMSSRVGFGNLFDF